MCTCPRCKFNGVSVYQDLIEAFVSLTRQFHGTKAKCNIAQKWLDSGPWEALHHFCL